LGEFGAPLQGLTPTDFATPGKFFRMGRAPLAIDILLDIDGIGFEQAWQNRMEPFPLVRDVRELSLCIRIRLAAPDPQKQFNTEFSAVPLCAFDD
jgi:hypothetical protein